MAQPYSMRDKIGIGFFIASLCVLILFFIMINQDHGHDIGAVIHGALGLFILIISIVLFLISIAFGWGLKFFRYLFFNVMSIVLVTSIFNIGSSFINSIIAKSNNEQRNNDEEIIKQLIVDYEDKLQHIKHNEADIVSLLNEFEKNLRDENIPINMSGKGWKYPSLAYRKYVHDILFYLGLFFDEKYLQDERLGDAAFWYDESFTKYKDLFVSEAHFVRYFNLLSKKTYDDRDQSSSGLHQVDQENYAKLVLKNEYMNAYLALLPLLKSSYHTDEELYIRQLEYAIALDLKLNKRIATKAFLNKTTHYFYTSTKDHCLLTKTIESYAPLKKSGFLNEYMDLILEQFNTQCAQMKRWDYYGNTHSDKFKDAFCYIKKNPKWFNIIQLDTRNIKGDLLKKEYCLDL